MGFEVVKHLVLSVPIGRYHLWRSLAGAVSDSEGNPTCAGRCSDAGGSQTLSCLLPNRQVI